MAAGELARLTALWQQGVLTDSEYAEQVSILPNGGVAIPPSAQVSTVRSRKLLWLLGIAGPASGAAIGLFTAKTTTDFVASIMAMAIVIWGGALALWLPVRIARWFWPKLRDAWNNSAVPSSRTVAPRPDDTDDHRVGVQKWIAAKAAMRQKTPLRAPVAPFVAKPPPRGAAWHVKAKPSPARSANEVGPALQNGPAGVRLKFEYADANGEITERSLTNWIEYADHIRGYCSMRRDTRTFRKDRVQSWHAGSDRLYSK